MIKLTSNTIINLLGFKLHEALGIRSFYEYYVSDCGRYRLCRSLTHNDANLAWDAWRLYVENSSMMGIASCDVEYVEQVEQIKSIYNQY